MRLKKLKLGNFKGVRDFTLLSENGEDIKIYGANASGKTTLFDAVVWLLFGKDSLNQAKFEIQTLVKGKKIPAIEHSVEGIFILQDGTLVTLQKIFKEKYTKRRGAVKAKKTGHTTLCFVNGVPVPIGEYKNKVTEIAPQKDDLFQLLTSPSFFSASMSWKRQRQILLDVCSNFSDEEIMLSNMTTLSGLPEILNGKTPDEYKKIITYSRREINTKLASIPERIDEVSRSIPDENTQDIVAITQILAETRELFDNATKQLTVAKAGGSLISLELDLAALKTVILNIVNSHDLEEAEVKRESRVTLDNCLDAIRDQKDNIETCVKELTLGQASIKDLNASNDNLRNRFAEIVEQELTDFVCPTCNQELLEEGRQDCMKKFNIRKAEKLEDISSTGKYNAKRIKGCEERIIFQTNEQKVSQEHLLSLEKKAGELERGIKEDVEIRLEERPLYIEAMSQQRELVAKIEANDDETGTEGLESAQIGFSEIIKKYEAEIAAIEAAHKAQERIDELMAEEKSLAGQFETLGGHLHLIEVFTRAKVDLLTDRINKKFSFVRFKLFHEQENEGLQDVCEVMDSNGTPYNSLNSAMRVQAGFDIIKTLSEFYGFHPPIFVDNRESVTDLPEMDAQVISLIVSPGDEELRIGI